MSILKKISLAVVGTIAVVSATTLAISIAAVCAPIIAYYAIKKYREGAPKRKEEKLFQERVKKRHKEIQEEFRMKQLKFSSDASVKSREAHEYARNAIDRKRGAELVEQRKEKRKRIKR